MEKCAVQQDEMSNLDRLVNTLSTGLSTLSVEVRGLSSLRDRQKKEVNELRTLTTQLRSANLRLRKDLWVRAAAVVCSCLRFA